MTAKEGHEVGLSEALLDMDEDFNFPAACGMVSEVLGMSPGFSVGMGCF